MKWMKVLTNYFMSSAESGSDGENIVVHPLSWHSAAVSQMFGKMTENINSTNSPQAKSQTKPRCLGTPQSIQDHYHLNTQHGSFLLISNPTFIHKVTVATSIIIYGLFLLHVYLSVHYCKEQCTVSTRNLVYTSSMLNQQHVVCQILDI